MRSGKDAGSAVSSMRAKRAFSIVAAFACAGALTLGAASCGGRGSGGSPSVAQAERTGVVVEALSKGDGVTRAGICEQAGALTGGRAVPPEWYAEEVFDIGRETDVVALPDWSVAGFVSGAEPAAELERVAGLLSERGWTGFEGGGLSVATFYKEGGTCSWALVLCSRAGDTTSVVIQVQRST